MPDPANEKKKDSNGGFKWREQWRYLIPYALVGLMLLLLWQEAADSFAIRTIDYSEFKSHMAAGEVKEATVRTEEIQGIIELKAKPKSAPAKIAPAKSDTKTADSQSADKKSEPAVGAKRKPLKINKALPTAPVGPTTFHFRTIRVDPDDDLVRELEAKVPKYRGERPSLMATIILSWVLPLALLILLWVFISRRLGAAGQAVMSFGKSRAKLMADKHTGVTFADVAGCDEAKYELQEVVDFLKNPQRYEALGAKIPKGVLLVGPPGTGKTLLARAVAGEAKAPFFSLSGSDFVEMFVGVGASRVRDLFEQAKATAPCIIFIDELDAIGRQRGVHIGAVNDEREQTLNQLLVEMDGFAPNVGIIILAATNRPDVLDRALLRPGRFDRQVVVDAPDIDGRVAILKVHSREKPLAAEVDLRSVAQHTPGFSGADLANALNEAALLAARRGAKEITQHDLEEAVEKVIAGPERKSRKLIEAERRRVAYHEVGHALVAAYSEHSDPVHKISIVPRGRAALGYTLHLPEEEQFLLTRADLIDRIKGLLGGRAAEEVVFGDVSTGAENDLDRATAMARRMVCIYGMSPSVGLVHIGHRQHPFLSGGMDGELQRDFSEHTARDVDAEVKKLLDDAYHQAKQILTDHRDQLESVSQELLEHENIDRQTFNRLIGRSAAANGEAPPAPETPSPLPTPPAE